MYCQPQFPYPMPDYGQYGTATGYGTSQNPAGSAYSGPPISPFGSDRPSQFRIEDILLQGKGVGAGGINNSPTNNSAGAGPVAPIGPYTDSLYGSSLPSSLPTSMPGHQPGPYISSVNGGHVTSPYRGHYPSFSGTAPALSHSAADKPDYQGTTGNNSNYHLPVYFRLKPSMRGAGPSGRKCRKPRTVFSELQLMVLEREFSQHKYLSTPQRTKLAERLGLNQTQVKTWFQNRRMKWKKEATDTPPFENKDSNNTSTTEPTDDVRSRDSNNNLSNVVDFSTLPVKDEESSTISRLGSAHI